MQIRGALSHYEPIGDTRVARSRDYTRFYCLIALINSINAKENSPQRGVLSNKAKQSAKRLYQLSSQAQNSTQESLKHQQEKRSFQEAKKMRKIAITKAQTRNFSLWRTFATITPKINALEAIRDNLSNKATLPRKPKDFFNLIRFIALVIPSTGYLILHSLTLHNFTLGIKKILESLYTNKTKDIGKTFSLKQISNAVSIMYEAFQIFLRAIWQIFIALKAQSKHNLHISKDLLRRKHLGYAQESLKSSNHSNKTQKEAAKNQEALTKNIATLNTQNPKNILRVFVDITGRTNTPNTAIIVTFKQKQEAIGFAKFGEFGGLKEIDNPYLIQENPYKATTQSKPFSIVLNPLNNEEQAIGFAKFGEFGEFRTFTQRIQNPLHKTTHPINKFNSQDSKNLFFMGNPRQFQENTSRATLQSKPFANKRVLNPPNNQANLAFSPLKDSIGFKFNSQDSKNLSLVDNPHLTQENTSRANETIQGISSLANKSIANPQELNSMDKTPNTPKGILSQSQKIKF